MLGGIVGGALAIAIPVLITDISFDSVRGSLISFYDPLFNLGTFASFMLGNYLSCMTQVKIQLIPQLIFLIALFFLPESPVFLQARNKKDVRFHRPFGVLKKNKELLTSNTEFLLFSVQSNRFNFTKEMMLHLTAQLIPIQSH